MRNESESSEHFQMRVKEADAFVTSLKGPRPVINHVNDCVLSSMAGGVSAMIALALAGVHGDRFDYITIAVGGMAAGFVFLCRRFQEKDWQKAWIKRMEQTTPCRETQQG